MEVVCITNDAARAPGDQLDKTSHPEFVHTDLVIGKVYRVFAMIAFSDRLRYLVDTGRPKWISPVFFSVVDDVLPSDWRFKFSPVPPFPVLERRWVQAVWGYDFLLDNFYLHYNGTLEGDPAQVEVFRDEVARRAAYGERSQNNKRSTVVEE